MYLRILILFFVSLTLNAAEIVWDAHSAKKPKNVSDKEYRQALDNYFVIKNERNLELANKVLEKENYAEAEAVKHLTISADQGNAEAQNNLGNLYYDGHGVKQDYQEAARLYKLSANQGNARAQNNLGVLYQIGQVVKQNYQEAARLYQLSADKGNISAKKRLVSLCRSHPSVCR